MIDSPLNEMAPPLMPRQKAARKENIEAIDVEKVNVDEATEGEDRDKNRVGEDNVREELRRSTGGCLPQVPAGTVVIL